MTRARALPRRAGPALTGHRTAVIVAALAALATPFGALGCGPSVGPPLSQVASPRSAASFDYVAIDGAHLSSETTRGRVTVIAFITTYDLGSQAVLRELIELVHTHEPRINVGVVVLEPPKNAPLVAVFAETLELPFPIALADTGTLEARGPFGKVDAVPTLVILDRAGVERWRNAGTVPVSPIADAVDRASH